MLVEEPRTAPGAHAIRAALRAVYGDARSVDSGPAQPWRHGGPDPLDGITVYRCAEGRPHWHFVTFGFSELYAKESDDPDVSGWGFELSLRLACALGERRPPDWGAPFLQSLARVVFEHSRPFRRGAVLEFGGPIVAGIKTDVTALVMGRDPKLGESRGPNGRLEFLIPIGITTREVPPEGASADALLAMIAKRNPMMITDLGV